MKILHRSGRGTAKRIVAGNQATVAAGGLQGDQERSIFGSTTECPVCSTPFVGMFCATCGQRKRSHEDLSILHFMEHAMHDLTHLDSRILRSIRAAVTRPGFLTREYLAGREKRYMQPFQLFLVVNVIYFLFLQLAPITTFDTPLAIQYSQQYYSGFIRPFVDHAILESGLSSAKFEELYNLTTASQAKTLIILMVPMFSVVLSVLYLRSRRYFVEHLVFSLHFYSFFLLLCSFGVMLIEVAASVLATYLLPSQHIENTDALLTIGPGIICFGFLLVALRRVYKQSWLLTSVKSLLLTYSLLFIVIAYRFVLLFTTLFAVGMHH